MQEDFNKVRENIFDHVFELIIKLDQKAQKEKDNFSRKLIAIHLNGMNRRTGDYLLHYTKEKYFIEIEDVFERIIWINDSMNRKLRNETKDSLTIEIGSFTIRLGELKTKYLF